MSDHISSVCVSKAAWISENLNQLLQLLAMNLQAEKE